MVVGYAVESRGGGGVEQGHILQLRVAGWAGVALQPGEAIGRVQQQEELTPTVGASASHSKLQALKRAKLMADVTGDSLQPPTSNERSCRRVQL
ncbi:hypothetical protein L7F22_004031 [Adiantum nelumboides]|nr:hypothetical protein [Adiantum nelumboides]